ncbi:MAG: acetate uptake transporter [Acidimicrobiales bacterium]
MTDTAHQVPAIRRIANPVPVGVAGFALTTFTLGLYTSGRFFAGGEVLVFAFAAFYGGLVQLIAGFFSIQRGDTFPATFMTTYGAFWFSFAGLNLYVVPQLKPAEVGQTVTIFLIMWTVITVIFFISAFWTNWVVVFAFFEFSVTIILLDIATANTNTGLTHFCGYLEMLLGAVAWYIVLAEVINGAAEKEVLPLPKTPWHPPTGNTSID